MISVQLPTTSVSSVAKVTDAHFGTNFLFHQDRVGPAGTFSRVASAANVSFLRYPGGTVTEEYFDLSNPNRTSGGNFFSATRSANLTPLSDFLNFASSEEYPVIIVIPTYRYFSVATGTITQTAEAEVKAFVRTLLSGGYGQADIRAFEIGNEWYQDRFNWTASQFGAIQSKIALWIHEVANDLRLSDPPSILIQAGRGDDDQNGIDDNQELQNEIDVVELAAIDGIISHAYASTSTPNPLVLGGSIESRLRAVTGTWEKFLGSEMQHVVTEWNIGESGVQTTTINGLMRSSAILRVFTGMLEAGVDSAAIWTGQAASPAALSDREGGTTRLSPTGLLYHLLASELPGTDLLDPGQDYFLRDQAGIASGYKFVFESDSKVVLYVSSALAQRSHVSLDLGDLLSGPAEVSGTILGVANGTTPNGYFTDGILTHVNGDTLQGDRIDSVLDFFLNPFETIQLVISATGNQNIYTDPQSNIPDFVRSGVGNDFIDAFGGNDTITSGGGNDTIRVDTQSTY